MVHYIVIFYKILLELLSAFVSSIQTRPRSKWSVVTIDTSSQHPYKSRTANRLAGIAWAIGPRSSPFISRCNRLFLSISTPKVSPSCRLSRLRRKLSFTCRPCNQTRWQQFFLHQPKGSSDCLLSQVFSFTKGSGSPQLEKSPNPAAGFPCLFFVNANTRLLSVFCLSTHSLLCKHKKSLLSHTPWTKSYLAMRVFKIVTQKLGKKNPTTLM